LALGLRQLRSAIAPSGSPRTERDLPDAGEAHGRVPGIAALERFANVLKVLVRGQHGRLCAGNGVIYDPAKTYTDVNGVIHRTPFAGNVIPGNRLSNVGKNIATYYPLPQVAAPTGQSNFTGTDNVRDHAQEVTVKLDQQILPWWSVSGSYIFYEALQPLGNPLGTLPGSYSYTYHRQVDAMQLNRTWILNPTTVLTARYGNNRFPNLIAEVSKGFNPSTLGFPVSFTSQLQVDFFPTIFLNNFSQLGQDTSSLDNWKSQAASAALNKSAGKHSFAFGAEYRRIRMNFIDLGDSPGTYTFCGAFIRARLSLHGARGRLAGVRRGEAGQVNSQ
jgi:hypothetical protein